MIQLLFANYHHLQQSCLKTRWKVFTVEKFQTLISSCEKNCITRGIVIQKDYKIWVSFRVNELISYGKRFTINNKTASWLSSIFSYNEKKNLELASNQKLRFVMGNRRKILTATIPCIILILFWVTGVNCQWSFCKWSDLWFD